MAPHDAYVSGSVAHTVKRTVVNPHRRCRHGRRGAARVHRHQHGAAGQKSSGQPANCASLRPPSKEEGQKSSGQPANCALLRPPNKEEGRAAEASRRAEVSETPGPSEACGHGGAQKAPAADRRGPSPSSAVSTARSAASLDADVRDDTDKSSMLIGHPGESCAAFLDKEDRAAAAAATLLARVRVHAGKAGAPPGPRPVPAHRGALAARSGNVKARRACFGDITNVTKATEGVPSSEHVAAPALPGAAHRVRFDDGVVVHEVEPYAKIYGRHPRHFVFDKNGCMIPAAPGGFVQAASDDEEEDESACDEQKPADRTADDADSERAGEPVEDDWEAFLSMSGGMRS